MTDVKKPFRCINWPVAGHCAGKSGSGTNFYPSDLVRRSDGYTVLLTTIVFITLRESFLLKVSCNLQGYTMSKEPLVCGYLVRICRIWDGRRVSRHCCVVRDLASAIEQGNASYNLFLSYVFNIILYPICCGLCDSSDD